MLEIALIVGSTRPNRFADVPARWIAAERLDLKLSVLDLREERLPFSNESAAPIYTQGGYSEPAAEAWRLKIGHYDAFIALAAEGIECPLPSLATVA
jgi:NAD(P)H-dependent FMN reductase